MKYRIWCDQIKKWIGDGSKTTSTILEARLFEPHEVSASTLECPGCVPMPAEPWWTERKFLLTDGDTFFHSVDRDGEPCWFSDLRANRARLTLAEAMELEKLAIAWTAEDQDVSKKDCADVFTIVFIPDLLELPRNVYEKMVEDAVTVATEQSEPNLGPDEAGGLERWTDYMDTAFLVHAASRCEAPCPIHKPSDHAMKDWPLTFDKESGLMMRRCEHLFWHPDPDNRELRDGMYDLVHECCYYDCCDY